MFLEEEHRDIEPKFAIIYVANENWLLKLPILISLPVAMVKYSDKTQLKGGRIYFCSQFQDKIQEAGWQSLEQACDTHSQEQDKNECMYTYLCQLIFFTLKQFRNPSIGNGVTHS